MLSEEDQKSSYIELIKECYSDQINFFLNQIFRIIKSYKKSNNKKNCIVILLNLKKMKAVIKRLWNQ